MDPGHSALSADFRREGVALRVQLRSAGLRQRLLCTFRSFLEMQVEDVGLIALFFFQRFIYFVFWPCWAFVPVRGLSLVASGVSCLVGLSGFSLHWLLLLQSKAPRAQAVIVVRGRNCSVAHGIFLDQGSNLCLLCCTVDSVSLDHQGSPRLLYWMLSYECLVSLAVKRRTRISRTFAFLERISLSLCGFIH